MANLHDVATKAGQEIFKEAVSFRTSAYTDKIVFTFKICGHEYMVDAGPDLLKDPKGLSTIWLNLFKEFEKDLDAGVEERKERIIRPEGFNGTII